LEWHYTPKHGSWLNVAECEFSALTRSLPDRLAGEQALRNAVGAWLKERNNASARVDWPFSTAAARIKLKHLHPAIEL
jgi:hypothetical protein